MQQDTIVLKALEEAIYKNETWFRQTVTTILNEGVSNYPILVAYPIITEIEIGLPILQSERYAFNATTLEELAMKKVVNLEKVDEFRTIYKQKKESYCIFLLDQPAPQFIFVPYRINIEE